MLCPELDAPRSRPLWQALAKMERESIPRNAGIDFFHPISIYFSFCELSSWRAMQRQCMSGARAVPPLGKRPGLIGFSVLRYSGRHEAPDGCAGNASRLHAGFALEIAASLYRHLCRGLRFGLAG